MKNLTLSQTIYGIESNQALVNTIGSQITIIRYFSNGNASHLKLRNGRVYAQGGCLPVDAQDRKNGIIISKKDASVKYSVTL